MNFLLPSGEAYDTTLSEDRDRLVQRLKNCKRKQKQKELDCIQQQLLDENVVSWHEIDLYEIILDKSVTPASFGQNPKPDRLRNEQDRFTFTNNAFYQLPSVSDPQHYPFALIDKLLYRLICYDRNSAPCILLRQAIDKFLPGSYDWNEGKLEQVLTDAERRSGTYFGDHLSDDSDSEAEQNFNTYPSKEKESRLRQARRYKNQANCSISLRALKQANTSPPKPDLKKRQLIGRSAQFDERAAQRDLNLINQKLKSEGRLTEDFLINLDTRFLVAQFRGNHYMKGSWDAESRRSHRRWNETGKPQFSSAALEKSNIANYRDFVEQLRQDSVAVENNLLKNAQHIQRLLLAMQYSPPVTWKGYAYPSLFYLLQHWYSSSYDKFSSRLRQNHALFQPYLDNNNKPFVSFSDLPHHACKYAFGDKLYKGHRHKKLAPRWRKSGKAEYPHSGKVYVSLHPLTDFSEQNPSHITSLFKHGLVNLSNIIAAERETSFLGYLPADRVVLQYVAKYPSFQGDYKTVYEEKYGIDNDMYTQVKKSFQNHPPHSKERLHDETILTDYLCAYQEVRLMDQAGLIATQQGAVLIYRDEDGLFSLHPPDTPSTKNLRLGSFVMRKRELFARFAPDKREVVRSITEISSAMPIFYRKSEVNPQEPGEVTPLPNPTLLAS